MKSVLYIGNKLSAHGVNRTTIETLGPLLEGAGFRMSYASHYKNKPVRLLHMLWAVLFQRVDYVLIDTYSTSNFWYAFLVSQLCRCTRKRYIPILHGGNLPQRIQKNTKIAAMIFSHAFVNVAPSRYLKEAFKDQGYRNLRVVPNPVHLQDYRFKSRDRVEPRMLWVRAFADIYNPEMAVRVFAQVKQQYPNAALCMIGPDKDGSFQNVQALARELELPVQFPGKLTRAQWTQTAQDFDIFLNTTHADNTPVSVVEAMALGLAIVSTNVGGLPYLLQHEATAILVDDADVGAMAQAVAHLVSNPGRSSQMVHAARAESQRFDAANVVAAWREILT